MLKSFVYPDKSRYLEILRDARRELHKIPELAYRERETRHFILDYVKDFDCGVDVTESGGVVLFFNFAKKTTAGFRCEMDGLPVEENSGADYASKFGGKMHACGHDGHMAICLAFADIFDKLSKSEKFFPERNAALIFQPAEEATGGARSVADSGVLERLSVDRIFALHIWPRLAKGEIFSKAGACLARNAEIDMVLGCPTHHVADDGADSLAECARAKLRLENEIARLGLIDSPCILKFGRLVPLASSEYRPEPATAFCMDPLSFGSDGTTFLGPSADPSCGKQSVSASNPNGDSEALSLNYGPVGNMAREISRIEAALKSVTREKKKPRFSENAKAETGARNILGGHYKLEGTLRSLSDLSFDAATEMIKKEAEAIRKKGFSVALDIREGSGAVINDGNLFRYARQTAHIKTLDKPFLQAEDFSAYSAICPVLYLFLGTGEKKALHSSSFDFDEEILLNGLDTFLKLFAGGDKFRFL